LKRDGVNYKPWQIVKKMSEIAKAVEKYGVDKIRWECSFVFNQVDDEFDIGCGAFAIQRGRKQLRIFGQTDAPVASLYINGQLVDTRATLADGKFEFGNSKAIDLLTISTIDICEGTDIYLSIKIP
jgi:hypothetical protein